MLQYAMDFPGHFARVVVWDFFTRDFFRDPGAFVRANDGLVLLEGIALAYCVTRFSDVNGSLPRSMLRMTIVGATAAAVLNAQRMVQIVLQQGGGWAMLLAMAPTTRVSVLHADVNAAGSYFAMVLPIALALGWRSRAQLGWLASAGAITVAIWLTGSRTAMAASGLGVVVFLAARLALVRTLHQRRLIALMLIAAIAIMVVGGVTYPKDRNTSPGTALDLRADMARAALHLFATQPTFGIGVGNFWARSGEYIPTRSKGTFAHENAHNNFLQLLSELGVAGLASFLCFVAAAIGLPRWRAGAHDLLVAGALSGVLGFLVTCFTGHPLLTREVAYPFWLLIGTTGALRAATRAEFSAQHPDGARRGRIASTLALVVAMTIPFRVQQAKLTRNFEDVSIGYSLWNSADDGIRFRWAERRSRFFVPANSAYVLIPLRLGSGGGDSSIVTVRLDGHVINTVTVLRDRWTPARVVLASGRLTPRYRLVELELTGSSDSAALMVGRPGL